MEMSNETTSVKMTDLTELENNINVPNKESKFCNEEIEHNTEETVDKEDENDFKDDDADEAVGKSRCCSVAVEKLQNRSTTFWKRHSAKLKVAFKIFLVLGYLAYFLYAMIYKFGDEGSIRLSVFTLLVVAYKLCHYLKIEWNKRQFKLPRCNKRINMIAKMALRIIITIGLVIYIIVEVGLESPRNLLPAVGLFVYISLCFIFSKNPSKIRWDITHSGICLQILIGIILLRTEIGYTIFKWFGDRIQEFLRSADAGAIMVFGPNSLYDHFVAFKVLPVIVYFASIIGILYYLGWMQFVIKKIGWLLQVILGTTAGESMSAAGNIFIGMGEAPLMIRPLLPSLTDSELHAVMTTGFATIAGSVLAAFINLGVAANHLLVASVMSAPAALAVSKLLCPEIQRSKTKVKNLKQAMGKSDERNIIEAAAFGAVQAATICAYIAANLISFVSLLDLANGTIAWFGVRVGIEPPHYKYLTLDLILSYIMWPMAYIMGVDLIDCGKVATLLGIKSILSEFVAFTSLGNYAKNREKLEAHNGTSTLLQNGDIFLVNMVNGTNTTLTGGVLNPRSEVIATYSLCGFANFPAMGILMGTLVALVPSRKQDISRLILRAMIAGNIACFMTGTIAGLLYNPKYR